MKSETNLPEKSVFYEGEVAIHHEQRLPCVLVLDTSTSMTGEPISELNKGLKIFQTEIQNDLRASKSIETALISFNSEVKVERDFALAEGTGMPDLEATGTTHLVGGVREALSRIEDRKAWYKSQGLTYYRPFIILITDGAPNGPGDPQQLKEEIQKGVDDKRFRFWAFGVTGADMNFLKDISHPEFPPQKLAGIKFREFFNWLSASLAIHSKSKPGENIDVSPDKVVGEENNPFQMTSD